MQAYGMDTDEREIVEYLKTFGEDWVAAKEICRRAGGRKRFNEDNNWARPILQHLKERNILEGDELGRYRIKPLPKHKGKWMSPDIEKILRESGVKADAERADAQSTDNPEHA